MSAPGRALIHMCRQALEGARHAARDFGGKALAKADELVGKYTGAYNPRPQTLNSKPSTLNPQPCTHADRRGCFPQFSGRKGTSTKTDHAHLINEQNMLIVSTVKENSVSGDQAKPCRSFARIPCSRTLQCAAVARKARIQGS